MYSMFYYVYYVLLLIYYIFITILYIYFFILYIYIFLYLYIIYFITIYFLGHKIFRLVMKTLQEVIIYEGDLLTGTVGIKNIL